MTIIFDNTPDPNAVAIATKVLEGVNRNAKVQIVALYHGCNYAIKVGRRVRSSVQHDIEDLRHELESLKDNGFDTSYAESQLDN